MYTGPQSGKFGVIHNQGIPITHMFNWGLDAITHSPETYYASNTRWAPNRNPGVIDWTGNFNLFDGKYIALPGQYLACLEFFTAPTSGVYGNPGQTYCGQAIIESNTITWAWGAEQSLTQAINVAANGCIACRSRTLDDTTIASPSKMCGLQVQWTKEQIPSTWLTIANVQQAVLTFTNASQLFVNSSTGCCTHRRPGNIDWTLALTMTDHRCIEVTREDVTSFRLFDSTTTYWELVYGIFASIGSIVADRQSGAIQSQVANYSMKAISDETLGHISWFNGATPAVVWPPVATTNTVPTAPSGVGGAAIEDDVTVSWTAESSGDATGYTIWASPDGIDFACVGCSVDSPFVDVGLLSAGTYYYKVAAYNDQGQGPFSAVSAGVAVS